MYDQIVIEIEELEQRIAPDSTAAVLDHVGPDSSDAGFLEKPLN